MTSLIKFSTRVSLPVASLAFALTFLCSCESPEAPELKYAILSPSIHQETIQDGRKAIRTAMDAGKAASLSLALIDGDQIAWSETFGFANTATKTPPGFETMYGIGSVSKMFATVATMKLVEQGKVALDTPLVTYVPSFRMMSPDYSDITVRMLLNHSSGLPGTEDRDILTSKPFPNYAQEVLSDLSKSWLIFTPGYLSVYNNDGFTMIENLVREVSGRSYVQFVDEEILKPLGMNHSRYPTTSFPENSFAHNNRTAAAEPQEYLNAYASGGLYSTPSDMARFAMMFIGKGAAGGRRILSESSIEQMATDQTAGKFNPAPSVTLHYGLGWDSITEPGLLAAGIKGWSKGGDTGSYGAALVIAPDEKLAIFITGTSGIGSTESTAIGEKILLRELAARGRIAQPPALLSQEPLATASPTPEQLDALTGIWGRSGGLPTLIKTEKGPANAIVFNGWDGTQWKPLLEDLRLRADGWFTGEKEPKISFSSVSADGRDYLTVRSIGGYGEYRDQQAFAQRLTSPGELSSSWRARLGKTWLFVNMTPDAPLHIQKTMDPRFKLLEIPGLEGLLVIGQSELEGPAPTTVTPVQRSYLVLDPSQASEGEEIARPMLLIPSMSSRDQDTLSVWPRNGEEWLRYGALVLRPKASIPSFASGSSQNLTISPQGYGEWRRIETSNAAKDLTLTTPGLWRIYLQPKTAAGEAGFKWLQAGEGNSKVTIPAENEAYILLFGKPGEQITLAY